jgi:hypothetical protein
MIINRCFASLLTTPKYSFSTLMMVMNRKKLPKNDLQKYNIIIVGGNLGTIMSYHLHGVFGYKTTIFVAD